MAGPWEKYQAAPQASRSGEGPWTKFAQPQADSSPDLWGKLEQQESGGNQNAVSPKGAIGVAQVMPGTAPEAAQLAGVPFDENRYKTDADYNRKLGQAYLGQQMKTFGDQKLALAAYNAGPGRVSQTIAQVGDPSKGQVSWDKFMDAMPEETRNYVRKISGPWSMKDQAVSEIKEGGRIAASGIKQGLGAIPKMLSQGLTSASQWGSVAADELGVPSIPGLRDLPAPTDLLKGATDYLFTPRENEVPETEGGKGASRVLGSTIAGVMSPGSIPANLAAGAAAGIGAEAGQQVGGETGALVGGLLGSVVPGGLSTAARLVGTPIKTKEKLAEMGLRNVNDYQLAIAKQRMQEAQAQGVNLTLPQAMPAESNLDTLQDMFVKMNSGEPLAAQLRNQPQEIADASKSLIQQPQVDALNSLTTVPEKGTATVGAVKGPQEIANQSQQAADSALKQLRTERTAAVTPSYQASGNIEPQDALDMTQGLRDAVRSKGQLDRSKTLTKLYNKLNPEKKVKQADGEVVKKRIPVTDVQTIDDTLRELEKRMSNKPKDPRAAAIIQSEIGKIRDKLGDLSPGYAEGSKQYAQITKDVINPAKQGPLGVVAGRTGYSPDTPASRTNLFGIFDRGTPEQGRSDILALQRNMAKGNGGRQAFADAGTSWFAEGLDKAMKSEGGQLKPDLARTIEQTFFATPSQSRGTRDVLAGVARSQGVDESVYVKGLDNWAQTIKAAAKRPSTTRGQSSQEVREGTETLASKMASTTILAPIRRPLEKLDEMINKDAYAYVSKLMQSPDGVETLKTLARNKPGSAASQTALAKFNATIAAQQAASE